MEDRGQEGIREHGRGTPRRRFIRGTARRTWVGHYLMKFWIGQPRIGADGQLSVIRAAASMQLRVWSQAGEIWWLYLLEQLAMLKNGLKRGCRDGALLLASSPLVNAQRSRQQMQVGQNALKVNSPGYCVTDPGREPGVGSCCTSGVPRAYNGQCSPACLECYQSVGQDCIPCGGCKVCRGSGRLFVGRHRRTILVAVWPC